MLQTSSVRSKTGLIQKFFCMAVNGKRNRRFVHNSIPALAVLIFAVSAMAQDTISRKLYHPAADAEKELELAIAEASASKRFVLVQIGGNWCVWCLRFHAFVQNDSALSTLVKKNFVTVHMNYSPENKNVSLLEKFGYPNRFGFPVFLILNDKGQLIHTQNSVYLEEKDSYDYKKVMEFFQDWSPAQFKKEKWAWLYREEPKKN